MTEVNLLCSGYLRQNHVAGYNDIALILVAYIDENPLTILVCHLYSDSFPTPKNAPFYFPTTLTVSQVLKSSIDVLKLDNNSHFKIFRECGVELKQSDIQNLENNDMLFITNRQESQNYTEYSRYIKNTIAKKYTRVTLFGKHVGKTSLAIQLIQGKYYEDYEPTYEDPYRKWIEFDPDTSKPGSKVSSILLEIWCCKHDYCIAYPPMIDSGMRGDDVIIFVFSIDDRQSFEILNSVYYKRFVEIFSHEDFDEYDVPLIILVGNKVDLRDDDDKKNDGDDDDYVSTEEGLKLLEKFGGVRYIETSAKTGYHVRDMFVGAAILTDNRKFQQYIKNPSTQTNGKSKCCNCQVL